MINKKMSNTFVMPLKITQGGILSSVEDNQGCLVAVVEDRHADAITRAVNLHDEMYAMVESLASELKIAIDEINKTRLGACHSDMITPPDCWDEESLHDAQVLLAKARGEKC